MSVGSPAAQIPPHRNVPKIHDRSAQYAISDDETYPCLAAERYEQYVPYRVVSGSIGTK